MCAVVSAAAARWNHVNNRALRHGYGNEDEGGTNQTVGDARGGGGGGGAGGGGDVETSRHAVSSSAAAAAVAATRDLAAATIGVIEGVLGCADPSDASREDEALNSLAAALRGAGTLLPHRGVGSLHDYSDLPAAAAAAAAAHVARAVSYTHLTLPTILLV